MSSCDTNFYKFAFEPGCATVVSDLVAEPRDPLINMALGFGLDERTDIDLPAESGGAQPDAGMAPALLGGAQGRLLQGRREPGVQRGAARAQPRPCVDGFRFRGGQATNFAIGQGETLVTPLQLASVYATVANGGKVMRPTVGRALLSADGRTASDVEPVVTRRCRSASRRSPRCATRCTA